MSKELIVRLREAAAQRVASTAMIGADDLSAAADALESQAATPSSHWRAEGQADPHAGHYDGERAALIMGNLTDDQLANAAFMFYNDDPSLQTLSDRWLPHWPFYNDYPSLQDVMDGKAFPPIAYMTAVKDRIRWLSRSLERVVSERDALAAELKGVRVTQQAPTTEDINLQEWKGMDGACAWHLIDRHADDWNHVARLMNAWLEANREDLVSELKSLREQEPPADIDPHDAMLQKQHDEAQGPLANAAHKVYFRAGLLACREHMARFVESQDPSIAASIRANWWPDLGPDMGPPRRIEWGELTEGEYGESGFRVKEPHEISPTIEALPIAQHFLTPDEGTTK